MNAVPATDLQPTVLHYHIFKNAGTSFNWSLRQYFKAAFFEYDPPTACGILSEGEIVQFASAHPEATVLSSHQALFPPPSLAGRQIISTLLIRDPIARIRSIYIFERQQQVRNPGADKAKELDFKGYVEWRLTATPTMLCNYQVHYCSRTLETANCIPAEAEFERAVRHLEATSAVGTVERYRDWLELVSAHLRPHFPDLVLQTSQLNVSAHSSGPKGDKLKVIGELCAELGENLVHRLIEGNQLDLRLHQVADGLLSQALAMKKLTIRLEQDYWNSLKSQTSPAVR